MGKDLVLFPVRQFCLYSFVIISNIRMVRKKNKRSRQDEDLLSENMTTSTPNTSEITRESAKTPASLQTLSEDFSKMMDILRDTRNSVHSIDQRFTTLENKIQAIESEQMALRTELSGSSSRMTAVGNEVSMLKTQVVNLQTEVKYYKEKTLRMSGRIMATEYQPTENNVIVRNTVCEDEDQAKGMFTELCTDGLALPVIPQFSVIEIKKDKKYFKVNVSNRENKIEILKNGKKLKGKMMRNQQNIYVSDDAPLSEREARKRLYEKKSRLSSIGITSWVSNTVPPYLQFERPGGRKVKFTCDESIDELAYGLPPSAAPGGPKE